MFDADQPYPPISDSSAEQLRSEFERACETLSEKSHFRRGAFIITDEDLESLKSLCSSGNRDSDS